MTLTTGNNYTGEFQHTLDAKNRVTIPSKWRPSKDSEGDGKAQFLLIPMPAGFVAVYPQRMIDRLNEVAANIGLGDRKGQRALRRIFSLADTVISDGQGRVTLSEKLLQHAKIDKDSILNGMLNYFEIWNPEAYQKQFEEDIDEEADDEISAIFRQLGL